MSNDSSLDNFLAGIKKGKRKSPKKSSRFLPIDLLNLPDIERQIISYLIRSRQASFDELKTTYQDTNAKEAFQNAFLALKEKNYVLPVLIKGEIQYRAALAGVVGQSNHSVSQKILARMRLDKISYLKQSPLFQGLSENVLKKIAQELETGHYSRNEVIVWQGEQSGSIFLIRNGILGITRLSPGSKNPQLLAYLKEGDILGDVGILENQSRSATATALSAVEVLSIKRATFLALLQKYNSMAIELARMLGKKLLAANTRLGKSNVDPHLILLFSLTPQAGRTIIGGSLAATLVQTTERPTVYTEYKTAQNLAKRFNFETKLSTYTHKSGYDVVIPDANPELPVTVQTTLMLDDLLSRYSNIILSLPGKIEAGVVYMLERASQVILITPPEAGAYKKLKKLQKNLKKYLHPEKTGLFTIINHAKANAEDVPIPEQIDFQVPHLPDMPPIWAMPSNEIRLPKPLANITQTLVDGLGRTHQVGVYIPTTIDVDQSIDTSAYVEKTLAFLGERFGGATSSESQGVWNSDEVGLVNETVYVVRSFVTETDMNTHLDTVLGYVEKLKEELKQEAMAVEVDQKLILI